MKNIFRFVVIPLLVIAALIFVTEHVFLVSLAKGAVKYIVGLETHMNRVILNPFDGSVTVRGLRIMNPSGFKDPVLAHAPLVVFDFNPKSIKQKGVFFDRITISVKELNIVRNEEDVVNLEKVKALTPQEEPEEKPPFGVRKLVIEIGRVNYINYTEKEDEQKRIIELDLKEEYKNVTDSFNIPKLVAYKIFFNGKTGNIGVDIQKIQSDLAKLAENNKNLAADLKAAVTETAIKAKEQVGEKIEEAKEKIEEIKDRMNNNKENPAGGQGEQRS